MQQATLQFRLRNEVPGSFDSPSLDCAVCDLECKDRCLEYAALAVDVLEVCKRETGLRMLIKCGNCGREFIGPDQVICVKKCDVGRACVRESDIAWARRTAAGGLLQQR